jgi:hypothetical protein
MIFIEYLPIPNPRISRHIAKIGKIPIPRFVSPQKAEPRVAIMIIINSIP